MPKEIKEQIKEEEDKIKEDINRKLYEHFKNKPVNNVLNATIVKTYPELLEWLDYDKIIVWGTKIIDGSTVEVCWAHKEDDIEAELYIRKDFYDMKWSRYKL